MINYGGFGMPMLSKKLILCLLISMVLLLGCDKKDTNPPSNDGQKPAASITDITSYFYIDKNPTWEYQGTGNEYASFTRKVLYQENNLVQITDDNGGTVMAMIFKLSPEEIVKIYAEAEFYDNKNILSSKPNRQEIILKSPLKVGAEWQDENYKSEVISIDETLEVPAGKYNQVVKIKRTSLKEKGTGENYEYYAKGVGLVMREYIREYISEGLTVTSQLRSVKKN